LILKSSRKAFGQKHASSLQNFASLLAITAFLIRKALFLLEPQVSDTFSEMSRIFLNFAQLVLASTG